MPHIDAQTFGLGKERLATAAAIAVRFEPLKASRVAVQRAYGWLFGGRIACAGRTTAEVVGQVAVHGVGLPGQQQVKEQLAQLRTDVQGDAFELIEGRAERRTVGPEQAIGEIFCLPLKQEPAGINFRYCLGLENHPWLFEEDTSRLLDQFSPVAYHNSSLQGKPSRAPTSMRFLLCSRQFMLYTL